MYLPFETMRRPPRGAVTLDIDKTMLDELTRDCRTPQDVEKLYSQMLQHMINRALEGEMQAHLGHERHGRSSGNVRNGKGRKRVQSAVGELQIETPRDRDGTFEPQLVPKRQVRLAEGENKDTHNSFTSWPSVPNVNLAFRDLRLRALCLEKPSPTRNSPSRASSFR